MRVIGRGPGGATGPAGTSPLWCHTTINTDTTSGMTGATDSTPISAGTIANGTIGLGATVAISLPFDAVGLTSLLLSIGTPSDPTALLDSYEIAAGGGAVAGVAKSVAIIGGNPNGYIGYAGEQVTITLAAAGVTLPNVTAGEIAIVVVAAVPGVL